MAEVVVSWQRERLGGILRTLRDNSKIGRAEVAKVAGWDTSKLSRIETGAVPVSKVDADFLLNYYKVGPKMRMTVMEAVKAASEPGWYHEYVDVVGQGMKVAGLDDAALQLDLIAYTFMPTQLATPDYVTALLHHADLPDDQRQRLIEYRVKRIAKATERGLVIKAVLDELSLYRPIGSHAVMADLCENLISLAGESRITLWLIPSENTGHPLLGTGFKIYTVAPGERYCTQDSASGTSYISDDETISALSRSLESIRDDNDGPALSPALSVDRLRKIKEWHSDRDA